MDEFFIISEGWHELSGFCECTFRNAYDEEDINALIIRIDDKNYLCYEDPSDGYRSYSKFKETDKECTNTFPPQRVMLKHSCRHDYKAYKFYNPDFELVLLVGTDNYDDYYPVAVWEWHPENLPINKGIHKKEYEMPGELTMKIKEKFSDSVISVEDVLDTIDHYYRLVYQKGRMDVVKQLEDTIGTISVYSHGMPVGRYVTTLEDVIAELRNIDSSYKKEINYESY